MWYTPIINWLIYWLFQDFGIKSSLTDRILFEHIAARTKRDVDAKGQSQWSKVKVTEVKTQLNRFRTVTPVWIHQWLRSDEQSLK